MKSARGEAVGVQGEKENIRGVLEITLLDKQSAQGVERPEAVGRFAGGVAALVRQPSSSGAFRVGSGREDNSKAMILCRKEAMRSSNWRMLDP